MCFFLTHIIFQKQRQKNTKWWRVIEPIERGRWIDIEKERKTEREKERERERGREREREREVWTSRQKEIEYSEKEPEIR